MSEKDTDHRERFYFVMMAPDNEIKVGIVYAHCQACTLQMIQAEVGIKEFSMMSMIFTTSMDGRDLFFRMLPPEHHQEIIKLESAPVNEMYLDNGKPRCH